jgi:predicted nuclease of restriction endonuclease-like RecB superfamily
MRYLKFFRLLYSLRREGDMLQLTADGPLSLLGATGRYGMHLAQFLPALLLWPDHWTLSASVRLRPGQPAAELALQPHRWLRSHYPDQGQWVPEELVAFIDGMAARGQGWQAEPAAELIPLPDNRFLIPDVVLHHPRQQRRLYLEYLPYPSRERVEERGRLLAGYGRGDYLVACRHVPALDGLVEQAPWLVAFRRNLLPSVVVRHLAALPPEAGARTKP